jgi:hypothetical protein
VALALGRSQGAPCREGNKGDKREVMACEPRLPAWEAKMHEIEDWQSAKEGSTGCGANIKGQVGEEVTGGLQRMRTKWRGKERAAQMGIKSTVQATSQILVLVGWKRVCVCVSVCVCGVLCVCVCV